MLKDRNVFLTCAINLVILAAFICLLFFGSEGALAQVTNTDRPDRGSDPSVRWCKVQCPPATRRHHNHAQTQASPSPSPSVTPEPGFKIEAYIFVGNKARGEGKLDEAASHYNRIIEIDSNVWRAYYGLGNISFDRALLARANNEPLSISDKFFTDAIRNYKLAIDRLQYDEQRENNEVSELYSDLAQVYLNLFSLPERISEATKAVEEAIRLKPRSASAYRRWGNIFYAQGNLEEAIKKYQQSLEFDPANILTHRALGAIYSSQAAKLSDPVAKKERYAKAEEEFKKVVSLEPDYVEGQEILGRHYFEQKQYKDAIEPYKKAVELLSKAAELKPRLVKARLNLALSYYCSGNHAAAQQEYEKLKTEDKDRAREYEIRIQNC
jgi:tetratricopeptide (TPR) repeat protein